MDAETEGRGVLAVATRVREVEGSSVVDSENSEVNVATGTEEMLLADWLALMDGISVITGISVVTGISATGGLEVGTSAVTVGTATPVVDVVTSTAAAVVVSQG